MKSTSTLLRWLELEPIQNHEGIKTDFPKFDEFTKGLQPSQLIVMAGRPGNGNYAFTKCLLLNTSIRHHNPVAVFTLEHTAERYLQGLIAIESSISIHELNQGNHSKKIIKKINKAKKTIAKSPIYINGDLEFSLSTLITKITEFTKVFSLKLLVIHGYELFTYKEDSSLSRQQELDAISEELKYLAEAFNIVIIITHSLPIIYNCERHEDVKPCLKELYDDTPMAKYADLVIFSYRPEYYKFETWYDTADSCEDEAELIIAKNRHGFIHSFRFFYDCYRSRFNEVEDKRFKKQP